MNIKAIIEEKRTLMQTMSGIVEKLGTEKRAMTPEEQESFDNAKKRVEEINAAIQADSELRSLFKEHKSEDSGAPTEAELEKRSFEAFIRNNLSEEKRANLTKSANGYEVPASISREIITVAKEMSPLLEKCSFYQTKGTLVFPVYGETESDRINVAYATEFTPLTENVGNLGTIEVKGFLAGALAKISRSLIDNTDIDIVSFVISEMGKSFAFFIEREALNGTADKCTGILSAATNVVPAGAADKITADELIDVQCGVKSIYQNDAYWTINPKTLPAIRKLKDNDGRYLLVQSLSEGFPWTLLGKPVYLSDNMPELGSGKVSVLYGDMSGAVVKTTKNVEIQVLNEKYATEHAVGIVGWVELDTNIINHEKICVLKH